MSLRMSGRFDFSNGRQGESFNMTPIIDIVFLLIIFFLVVCQFIEAENFPVAVPDDCQFAQSDSRPSLRPVTVTVMKTSEGKSGFAVGAEEIIAADHISIADRVAELIDAGLKDVAVDRRVVTLRIDKDVCFERAQYALAGVAQSSATDIKMSALKNGQGSGR